MKKTFLNLFFLPLITLLFFQPAFATSTVQFENGAENFVFYSEGGSSSSDLFPDLKNLMPGDRRSENILIKNSAPDFDYIKIYLRAEPASASASEFLSRLTFNLYKDSELISSAPASESGSLETNFDLGTFNYGDEIVLTVELLAPASLPNEFADTSAEILWTFTAEAYKNGEIITPNTGASPAAIRTSISEIITVITLTTTLTLIILIIIKKQNQNSPPSRF